MGDFEVLPAGTEDFLNALGYVLQRGDGWKAKGIDMSEENLNPANEPAENPVMNEDGSTDQSLLQKAASALGDDTSEDTFERLIEREPIVTDEYRAQTAAEAEIDRKAEIRKKQNANQRAKNERQALTRRLR